MKLTLPVATSTGLRLAFLIFAPLNTYYQSITTRPALAALNVNE